MTDKRGLFKVNFGHFDLFIWSTKEKIIEDMHNLYDERDGRLIGEIGSNSYDKIEFICYDFQILEVGTGKIRG